MGYERFIDKDRIIILVNTLEKEERISLSNIEGRVVDLLDINKDYILINKNIDILISAHKFIILKVFCRKVRHFYRCEVPYFLDLIQ